MKAPFVSKVARTFLLGSILGLSATRSSADTNGIFAEFNTSMGSFTCRVDYATAPKASANFIGLATGERAWLDLASGSVKTESYYEGQIFHRVIAGFMNQGGSPNGQGTDGPGYTFVDEFDTNQLHTGFGDLSMANIGPDSNGSQFFTTVTDTFWLDFKHTVFGRLTGGSNVVYTINNVATDSGDRPLTNVVLQSVVIRRVGAAAEAFDIHAQGLPEVVGIDASIAMAGSNVSLTFSNQLNADNSLYRSTNLSDWSGSDLGITVELPVTNLHSVPIAGDREFFRMAQVKYPDTVRVPRNVLNQTLTLDFPGAGTMIIAFDDAGGGSYTGTLGTPGLVTDSTWIQDAYRGRFLPIQFSTIVPMKLHLDFDTTTQGTFTGTAHPSGGNPFDVAGTFTMP